MQETCAAERAFRELPNPPPVLTRSSTQLFISKRTAHDSDSYSDVINKSPDNCLSKLKFDYFENCLRHNNLKFVKFNYQK